MKLFNGFSILQAQRLCTNYGQTWRAATLDGQRLFHDPNYNEASTSTQPIEGNKYRTIWKQCASALASEVSIAKRLNQLLTVLSILNFYERASYGALCEHLKAVLPACQTWEDHIWVYFKCYVEARVNEELETSIHTSTVIGQHIRSSAPHNTRIQPPRFLDRMSVRIFVT